MAAVRIAGVRWWIRPGWTTDGHITSRHAVSATEPHHPLHRCAFLVNKNENENLLADETTLSNQ